MAEFHHVIENIILTIPEVLVEVFIIIMFLYPVRLGKLSLVIHRQDGVEVILHGTDERGVVEYPKIGILGAVVSTCQQLHHAHEEKDVLLMEVIANLFGKHFLSGSNKICINEFPLHESIVTSEVTTQLR